jgi:hypothetical protein
MTCHSTKRVNGVILGSFLKPMLAWDVRYSSGGVVAFEVEAYQRQPSEDTLPHFFQRD